MPVNRKSQANSEREDWGLEGKKDKKSKFQTPKKKKEETRGQTSPTKPSKSSKNLETRRETELQLYFH